MEMGVPTGLQPERQRKLALSSSSASYDLVQLTPFSVFPPGGVCATDGPLPWPDKSTRRKWSCRGMPLSQCHPFEFKQNCLEIPDLTCPLNSIH